MVSTRCLAPARALGTLAASLMAACGARSALWEPAGDGGPPRTREVCNGIDDDGNGVVDDAIEPVSCGTGGCARTVPGCVNGAVPACVPGDPAAETCNGIDDDCNGVADDGLPLAPAGDPVVVRAREGSTGPCTSCSWAFGTQLWDAGGSMLAVWYLGFDGTRAAPTTFVRALGYDGRPAGEIVGTFAQPVTLGLRLAPGADGHALLTFCGRADANDVASAAALDARGAVAWGPTVRTPLSASCGAARPDGVFTGERTLFAWTDNRGDADFQAVHFDVADARGRSLGTRVIERNGDLGSPPRMTPGHGEVVLLTGYRPDLRASELRMYRLDLLGNSLGEPTSLGEAGGGAAWGPSRALPTETGWLVLATPNSGHGWISVETDAQGQPAGPAVRHEMGSNFAQDWDAAALPGGGFVLVGTTYEGGRARGSVRRLDAHGAAVGRWDGEPAFVFSPSVVAAGGRLFVLYAEEAHDSEPNRVMLQEFACAGP